MTTEQKPINSGFGMRTEARDAIGGRDLTGKVAIVTGGYSGLGLETTKALAAAGAIVIVPARSAEKAQKALVGIPNVEQAALDLSDPQSIDAFAGSHLAFFFVLGNGFFAPTQLHLVVFALVFVEQLLVFVFVAVEFEVHGVFFGAAQKYGGEGVNGSLILAAFTLGMRHKNNRRDREVVLASRMGEVPI